jgi:hypothetical protein
MRRIFGLLGVTCIAACLPACGDQLLEDTQAARQRWESQRPSRYEIVVEQRCFCREQPRHTTVDGSRVSAVNVGSTGVGMAPLGVEQLFDAMLRRLDADHDDAEAAFHPEWHYPTSFSVDPDSGAHDDEWGFAVTCFAEGEAHCPK